MRATLAGILSSSCILVSATWAFAAVDPSAQLLGHVLVNNAYHRSRATTLPASLSARQAQILLQFAKDADPENVHTLKLLVEAAASTGETDVERDALRSLIRLDAGDLVAQVQYIDLIAAGSQAIDVRAKVFQGAMDKSALDPQIRSEMAVRLARIAVERGDTDGAKEFLKQALQLNDVNIEALQESVRLAEKPEDRLKALVALLTANPLLPEAWVETARLLEGANLHGQAADFLVTSIEQMPMAGQQPPADVYLALGIDLAIAGRRAEAYPILNGLAKLPDAPLNALVAARLLQEEYTVPANTPGATSQPSADDLATTIRKRLADAIQADPKSPAALADAIWIELSLFPQASPDTAGWLKSYQELVPADDPTVARFQGWQLFRAGKLEEAAAAFAKSAGDPFAQLGLARVLVAQNKMSEAAQQLQDLWWTHPTGIFAYQVAETAHTAGGQGVKISDAISAQQLLTILTKLPPSATTAHRQPRDLQLITTDLNKRNYQVGEPMLLSIRINNTTDHAAPVGPDGLIKSTVGILGRISGVGGENLGIVSTEDLRRTFRIEQRGTIEATIRLDQGKLDDLFQSRLLRPVPLSVALVTAPLGTTSAVAPGLGGQVVSAGDLQRVPYPMQLPGDVPKLIQDAQAATGDQQLIKAQMLGVAAAQLSEVPPAGSNTAAAGDADARGAAQYKVDTALQTYVQSPSPVMRAYLLLTLPEADRGALADKLAALSADPDRMVRMAWGCRTGLVAESGGAAAAAATTAIQNQADAEKDPLVKRWLMTLIESAKASAAHPATQP